jgi:hypothetical protein
MPPKSKIALAFAVFLVTYGLFLLAWVQVKPFYGQVLTRFVSQVIAGTTQFKMDKIEKTQITFSRPVLTKQGFGDMILELTIPVSNYTFNTPLTFALIAGLFVIFRWPLRHFIGVCLVLLVIHLMYIYAFCTFQLFFHLAQGGYKILPRPLQLFVEFLWSFTDNMVVRFEPFLVFLYLWLMNTHLTGMSPERRKRRKAG